MFCSKCGRQIPDGSVCSCQQAAPQQTQYQAPQQPQYQAPARPQRAPINKKDLFSKFTLDKVVFTLFTILLFGIHFTDWYKIKDNPGSGFGPYGVPGEGSIGDISGFMVVIKVFLIINIVVFAAWLVTSIININVFVPALSKIDLNKLLGLAFYGLLVLCVILGFIAGLTAEYDYYFYSMETGIAGGWWLTLYHTLIGIVLLFKPNLVSVITSKVKALNA
ncbi:MAG: hypothetical protein E7597_03055 [Ruminococcaceae bacterium]|nr:hypothetical protein [Oscillospiraceae bacterium]